MYSDRDYNKRFYSNDYDERVRDLEDRIDYLENEMFISRDVEPIIRISPKDISKLFDLRDEIQHIMDFLDKNVYYKKDSLLRKSTLFHQVFRFSFSHIEKTDKESRAYVKYEAKQFKEGMNAFINNMAYDKKYKHENDQLKQLAKEMLAHLRKIGLL